VATESANNATVGGTFIPTLALGIPGDATTAIFISALLILGIFSGPMLFVQHPEIVGGIFMVNFATNILLVVIGILTTPIFIYTLRLKKAHLTPIVLLMCGIGTLALQASVFDLWVMFGFGVLGTVFRMANYPLSPIVIGLVLGPFLEKNLRRSILISRDGLWIFFDRPVAAALIVLNLLLIGWANYSFVRRK
jgi:putative tricarboxylic transport membrane protein